MKSITRILCLLAGITAFTAASFAQNNPDAALKISVTKLQTRGFIAEADAAYWLENARTEKNCDGEKVGELIIACISSKKKVGNIDEACDYIDTIKLLQKTAYWRKNAVKGKSCTGNQTAALIQRLNILTAK